MTTAERKPVLCHKQKVIVSGATGFVGRHVVKELVEKGYEVFALVRDLEKASSIAALNNATPLHFDITKPNIKISLPIDSIFIHCAWGNVREALSLIHIEEHLINNYLAIKNIVECGIKNTNNRYLLRIRTSIWPPKTKFTYATQHSLCHSKGHVT